MKINKISVKYLAGETNQTSNERVSSIYVFKIFEIILVKTEKLASDSMTGIIVKVLTISPLSYFRKKIQDFSKIILAHFLPWGS